MTLVYLDYEELWVPWEIGPTTKKRWPRQADLPDELITRFHKAKDEIDAVWDEIRNYAQVPA